MADFQFEVEISAKIQELERALNKATASTQKAATKMEQSISKADIGDSAGKKIGEDLKSSLFGAVAVGAVAAGLAGGFKGLADQLDPTTRKEGVGIGESILGGVVEGLGSIPIVGALGKAIGAGLGAFSFEEQQLERLKAQEEVLRTQRRQAKFAQAAKDMEEERTRIIDEHNEKIAESNRLMEEHLEKRNQEIRSFRESIDDLESDFNERLARAAAGNDEAKQKELDRARELYDFELKMERQIADLREQGRFFEAKVLEDQKETLTLRLKEVQAAEEQAEAEKKIAAEREKQAQILREVESIEENLKRKIEDAQAAGDADMERRLARERELAELREAFEKKIQAAREAGNEALADDLRNRQKGAEFQLKQLHMIEDQKRAEEEAAEAAKKAEEEDKKRAEEAAKIAEKQKELEAETAMMRQEAEKKVAAATVSFSTAGGTFITGADAQVNESKILNKIQKKSQDLLERIAANTGRTGVGFA